MHIRLTMTQTRHRLILHFGMLRVVEAIKRELGLPNEIEGAVSIINAANAANAVIGTVSWLHTAVGSFLKPRSDNPCRKCNDFLMGKYRFCMSPAVYLLRMALRIASQL